MDGAKWTGDPIAISVAYLHRLARAPASSANLGPGFDTLAVALALYVEVEVSSRPQGLLVVSEGEGAHLPADEDHLAAQVVAQVLGDDHVQVKVRSQVPVARGLGSSAALAVAAAAAAGATDPFAYGVGVDGHPENAAASFLGGLVSACLVDGQPVARRLPLDPALRFVVLVPDRQLPTADARSVLPADVAFADACFNLGRMGLLVAGLADHTGLMACAGDDRLHQPHRSALFPEASTLLEGLRKAGALTSCWSGAGPSLLGICGADDAADVAAEAEELMSNCGVPGVTLLLEADKGGLQVKEMGD